MKLIHLNVESFKYFDALVDFLEAEKPDILSLVEATDGKDIWSSKWGSQRDYIGELCKRFSWNSIFHPTIFRDCWTHQIGFGAAVLSRYNLDPESRGYLGEKKPTLLAADNIAFSDRPKYEKYPNAWKFSLPLLATQIQTEKWPVRLLTVHFHVSYECLETLQIWQDAERVVEYLNTHDDIPTILTGDLNIRNESMAVKIIREKLTQHSESFTNTLCRSTHPLFLKDENHPGLGIDHIFTKKINVALCEVREVAVSDHLPLVLDFSL
jgi:hypothetical protein